MRRMIAAPIAAIVMAVGLTGCGEITEIGMSNITSEIYSDEELDSLVASMTETLDTWGDVPEAVRYLGDELCTDEEILAKLNGELSETAPRYTECIGFSVDYHSSTNPVVVIRKLLGGKIDQYEVSDCQWWFARTENGFWETAYTGQVDIREQT